MITGFNTDIEHQGIVYHVQTEDKGLDNPLLLSLVYVGGEILASKRATYNDLIAEGFNETVLQEKLNRQHKLICAAIKSGRIEELKRMNSRSESVVMPESKTAQTAVLEAEESTTTIHKSVGDIADSVFELDLTNETRQAETDETLSGKQSGTLENEESPVSSSIDGKSSGGILEVPVQVVRKPANIVYLSENITSSNRLANPLVNKSLKENAGRSAARITPSKVSDGEISIKITNEQEYRGGKSYRMLILVNESKSNTPLPDALVVLKILGSAFRPTVVEFKTDEQGFVEADIEIPSFRTGRAAILIKVSHQGKEGELRRIVTQI